MIRYWKVVNNLISYAATAQFFKKEILAQYRLREVIVCGWIQTCNIRI